MPRKTTGQSRDRVERWHISGNFAHYMSRALNRLNLELLEILRPHRMTNQHYRILQALYEENGLTIGALSKRMVIAQPVLSRVLTQMETRALVTRRPSAHDSRYREIVLTERGRRAYEAIWPEARRILETALAPLGADDRKRLLALLMALDKPARR